MKNIINKLAKWVNTFGAMTYDEMVFVGISRLS